MSDEFDLERRLCRIPFEEAQAECDRRLDEWCRQRRVKLSLSQVLADFHDKYLPSVGWTQKEYHAEWRERLTPAEGQR